MQSNYEAPIRPIAYDSVDARSVFIMRTYAHLVGALLGFVVLEAYYLSTGIAQSMAQAVGGRWLLVLGAFMVGSWLTTRLAHAPSKPAQYAGLAGGVVVWSVIFAPLLAIAGPLVTQSAALVSVAGFIGLTAIAFVTRKDFSFMRGALLWIGILALVAIVSSALFGFALGTWFSVAMIGFAGAAILYDTSNVLHHYGEDQYVGAALQLFASFALLLWYVVRLLGVLSDD